MTDEFEFTNKKLDLNKLIDQGFEIGQAKAIIELGLNQRAIFEKEVCPTIKKEVGIRTKADGTIIGIACSHYKSDNGYCPIRGQSCMYHSMIGK